jgi:hypothetical protein
MNHPGLRDDLDEDKLAEVALAMLSLTLHEQCRAWKGIDWSVMELLHERGWIHDPRGKAKSVVLTEAGLGLVDELMRKHFVRQRG